MSLRSRAAMTWHDLTGCLASNCGDPAGPLMPVVSLGEDHADEVQVGGALHYDAMARN